MGASLCIGRLGRLAAVLGVGVGLTLFAGGGVATADDAGSTAASSAESRPGGSARAPDRPSAARGAPPHRGTGPDGPAAGRGAAAEPAAGHGVSARPGGAAADRVLAIRPPALSASAAVEVVDAPAGSPAGATVDNGISFTPTTELVDGVVRGSLNAVSTRGLPLTYTPLGGSAGGKIGGSPESYRMLPYATWIDTGKKGVETFSIRVSEVTPVTQFLVSVPVLGLAAEPVIGLLQQLPLVSTLLIPLIGASAVGRIQVDLADLAPGDTPVAFTYRVTSFDGTPISTNFIPAKGLRPGQTAPTVLNGAALAGQGETNPNQGSGTEDAVPGVRLIREAGFNVVTWDPRGTFDSGGVMQMDSPFFEGRDASAIISWAAEHTPSALDGPGDPRVGMVGASYGGGIQLSTAGTDPRIEAIVPVMSWNSLSSSLYPYDSFNFAWANILLGMLISSGTRVNNEVYNGILNGDVSGRLSPTSQAFLASSGPASLLAKLTAPTLLIQGTVDQLFPLTEAMTNAAAILANPYQTPVKMLWFCGGHGVCEDPENPGQRDRIFSETIAWMRHYVGGDGQSADAIPAFGWYDQRGTYHSSGLMPFQDGFAQSQPLRVSADGGLLGILPVIGGFNGLLTGKAANALNVDFTPPPGTQLVGSPQLSFTYRGIGTSRAVFAQLVDDATGRVVGNIVSPVPVVLDGAERTVSVPLNAIAYTAAAGDSLTLQITSSALLFENWSAGVVDVSDIRLDVPSRRL